MAPPVKCTFAIGQRINHFVVTGDVQHARGYRLYPIRCDCGTERLVRADWLVGGRVKSCGCKRYELIAAAVRTHGMSRTPEYGAWSDMRSRCVDPNDGQFKNYGGRGIKVCERWADFATFYADLGPRPSTDHSLDREDNDGDYCLANCRWATPTQQVRNRRVTLRVEHMGESRPLAELCEESGLPYQVVYERIYRYGLSVERALAKPLPRVKEIV